MSVQTIHFKQVFDHFNDLFSFLNFNQEEFWEENRKKIENSGINTEKLEKDFSLRKKDDLDEDHKEDKELILGYLREKYLIKGSQADDLLVSLFFKRHRSDPGMCFLPEELIIIELLRNCIEQTGVCVENDPSFKGALLRDKEAERISHLSQPGEYSLLVLGPKKMDEYNEEKNENNNETKTPFQNQIAEYNQKQGEDVDLMFQIKFLLQEDMKIKATDFVIQNQFIIDVINKQYQ